MNEEEKEARDILVNEIADILVGEYCNQCKICENEDIECYYGKAIDTIDNLIKKQQKEIEEKDEVIKKKFLHDYKEINEMIDNNFINKNKIREKIKELVNRNVELLGVDRYYFAIEILKELLEENK